MTLDNSTLNKKRKLNIISRKDYPTIKIIKLIVLIYFLRYRRLFVKNYLMNTIITCNTSI